MGQLFNRISRFVKSHLRDDGTSYRKIIDEADEELKRIIDELSGSKKKSNESKSESSNSERTDTKAADSRMGFADALKTLGVNEYDPPETIKAAYRKKMLEYHPDRLEKFGPDIKRAAAQKAEQINIAYDLIRKTKGFN